MNPFKFASKIGPLVRVNRSTHVPHHAEAVSNYLGYPSSRSQLRTSSNMSVPFKQAPHKLLLIPGPIELSDEVLYANAHPSMSHISPDFIPVFGNCIRMLRDVLLTTSGQPFLISGSGTLGWDQVASNLVEPGENALVVHSGYFGDSFAECLETYGAKVTQLKAPIGASPSASHIEGALKEKKYKVLTITHVDTSTGVLSPVKSIAEIVQRVSPEILVIVDAVCAAASEEIRFDDWGIDVVITATQKGLSTPPGLSVLVASQRALQVFENRKSPITSYYASWKNWLPIMKAYESGSPAYFATPPVNLIYAFHESLKSITQGGISLEERFRLHREASTRIKKAAEDLGLKQLPLEPQYAANGMTAVRLYFPDGLTAGDIIPRLSKKGIVVAGGLHKDIRDKYFRIGHMGLTAVDTSRGDLDKIINGIAESLQEAKAEKALN
ncbi:pyridoxal phosphate-dependent transferase [Cantharellus anzutake]|uniref:pyridoxal phosphate-dependent transferase n=1 Tax=Cantharellus anzutake TaxID=1750568 RepID=UPI00190572FE|nr:pyridoxal phosphate-dependent transferase [Cantharellus anzutake]KAF8327147.1 pyridoxal phosphate-dependent transferase [Cantharellus anzutake]